MPASLVVAVIGLGVWFVGQLVMYVVALSKGATVLSWPLTFAYFAFCLVLLVGVCRSSRLAWRISLGVAGLFAAAGLIGAVGLLLFALQDPALFFWDGFKSLLVATYMYMVFNLLRRPSSREFFMHEGTGRPSGGTSLKGPSVSRGSW